MRRDVFQAIADPVRREIIGLIAGRSLNLNTVAEHFAISRPAISKHIRILAECGLLSIRQQGRERYCEANYQQLKLVADWAEQYKSFWSGKMDALELLLKKEQKNKKKK